MAKRVLLLCVQAGREGVNAGEVAYHAFGAARAAHVADAGAFSSQPPETAAGWLRHVTVPSDVVLATSCSEVEVTDALPLC